MSVTDRDMGLKAIRRELAKANNKTVAIGILSGSNDAEGASIAEYAAHNEYGTDKIPSRPFMAMSFDENKGEISQDFERQSRALLTGKRTADQSMTIIGMKHAERIKKTITKRNITPKLAASTVLAKKGSTKTLVDTGAMVNAVQIEIRG